MSTSDFLPRRLPTVPFTAALVLVVLAASAVAGCSNSLPASVSTAPVLSVATGLYPLAQAAEAIGGSKAAVDDVIPAGTNPFTFEPASQASDILRSAGLVLEVGGGFQPGLESAASGAHSILTLRSALGVTDGYVWLDPATMQRAVQAIAGAMEAADPRAAPLFRQNATSFDDEIASTGIDFSSTLSACPGTALAAPDDAFGSMAAAYGLKLHVVGPDLGPAALSNLASALQDSSGPAVAVRQPWVDNSGVEALASAAGLHGIDLDTLAGAPAGGWPSGSSYLQLMEKNLGALSNALGCSNEEND